MPELHTPLDVEIAEVAAGQQGIVTGAQLTAIGLGARAQRQRVAAGRLHRLYPGVYAVGHPVLTVAGKRLAAVLACGDRAFLSHLSAAYAWGLLAGDGTRWDVTTPGPRSRAPAAVRVHRTRRLPPDHLTAMNGLPISNVPRTLVDLADVAPRHVVARALHEAEVLRVLDIDALAGALARLPGRRGTRVLRHLLASRAPAPHTRSQLEARFADLVADHGLPRPRTNALIDLGNRLVEVDALWSEQRVIAELDGEQFHRTVRAFHDDRARDAALAALGYVVIRLTWRRVTAEAAAVAGELRRILTNRRPAPSPPAPRPARPHSP